MSLHAVKPVQESWAEPVFDIRLAEEALRVVESGGGRLLSRGDQAEVYLHHIGPVDVIIKRAYGRGPARWLRRRMLRREARVYERLADIPGLPRCYGLLDGDCLLLEHFAGVPYREAEVPYPDRFLKALRKMIEAIHARGVAHGDLKTRDNILVTRDGLPHIIDFGIAALRSPRKGRVNRWWFSLFRQFDRNAWIKLKYKRRMDAIEPADKDWYHVTGVERAARRVRRFLRRLRGR